MQKRRQRPAVVEYAVFALAAFLALFLVYEVAKRRVRPAVPAGYALPDAPPLPPEAAPLKAREPQQAVGQGMLPRHHVDRVERPKRRPGAPIPTPDR